MNTKFRSKRSNRENGPTFLDFPLFQGIFQWDEPRKRFPFTAEPHFQGISIKWKGSLGLEMQNTSSKESPKSHQRLESGIQVPQRETGIQILEF